STASSRGNSPTAGCARSTTRRCWTMSGPPAPRRRKRPRSILTSFPSGIPTGGRRSGRSSPATGASTPSRRSTAMPGRRPAARPAADEVLNGAALAYALVRPPGHHAGRRTFGGFCYVCNGAVAANYLSHYGTVAILDIDYHHGNGQQDIFYERADVLTVSIH